MPVHNSPVHDLVKIAEAQPYGCHSLPEPKDHYWTFTWQQVTFRNSRLCRYDKRPTDPRCSGCTRPSDEEYLKSYNL